MKHISFTIRLYATFLLLFIVQKPLFMAYNHNYAEHLSASDFFDVIRAGLPLDLSVSAYLTAIPLLVALASLFIRRMNLKKWLTPYYIVVALIISVLFISDAVAYNFLGVKVDALELMYLSNPADMLASLTPIQALLGIAAVTLFTSCYTSSLRCTTPVSLATHRRWLQAILALPLMGLLFLAVRGGLGKSTANISYAYYSPVQFFNHSAVNPVFNMFHSLGKYEDIAHQFRFYPDTQVNQEWAPAFAADTTLAHPLLRTDRPDILLIIWEGCGSHFADDTLITPGFNRLKAEGTYFDHIYANSYRTDRGLVSILSGWQSLPTLSLMKRTDICRRLPSVSSELRHIGYDTHLYYGGDISFTNMRCYFTETGFNHITSDEDIHVTTSVNPWGFHDEWINTIPLFAASQGEGDSHQGDFSVILTLSSHEPWTVPYQRLTDERENSFAYADSCITSLIDSLRHTDRWHNLLVIITADHGIPWYSGQPSADAAIPHIPMLWLGGAMRPDAPRVVSTIGSQSDLAATLFAQMHLTPSAPFPLSRNILGRQYTAPFAFNASKGAAHIIDSLGIFTYDHHTDQPLTQPADIIRLHRTRSLLQYIYNVTARMEGK